MKILVDVMGGDNAPLELLKGAVMAAEAFDATITILGDETVIHTVAVENGIDLTRDNLEVVHTEDVITMEDAALSVVREKNRSSMAIGLKMLAEGKGDAFVSAGNTGALHAGSSLIVRRIRGIQRSAIATVLPMQVPTLLVDSGANIEVDPSHLCNFALLGSVYMRKIFGIESPRVGLLNNGAERTKGTKKLQETYEMLEADPDINFIGNIEGKDVPFGKCDVLVTDGFTGNILLKSIEGLGSFLMGKLKGLFLQNVVTKMSALTMKKGIKALKNEFNASEYGGAPLLGLTKPVIKAHGSSDARAIYNAIRQAIDFVDTDVIVEIARGLQRRQERAAAEAAEAVSKLSADASDAPSGTDAPARDDNMSEEDAHA